MFERTQRHVISLRIEITYQTEAKNYQVVTFFTMEEHFMQKISWQHPVNHVNLSSYFAFYFLCKTTVNIFLQLNLKMYSVENY